jgi:hypothetical protein
MLAIGRWIIKQIGTYWDIFSTVGGWIWTIAGAVVTAWAAWAADLLIHPVGEPLVNKTFIECDFYGPGTLALSGCAVDILTADYVEFIRLTKPTGPVLKCDHRKQDTATHPIRREANHDE